MVNRFTTFPWKVGECREDLQLIYHLMFDVSKKRTTPCGGDSLKSLDFAGNVAAATGGLLGEVALQQAFKSLAMAGFIAGHFVDGVVDSVEVQLLCQLGKLGLACGGTVARHENRLFAALRAAKRLIFFASRGTNTPFPDSTLGKPVNTGS